MTWKRNGECNNCGWCCRYEAVSRGVALVSRDPEYFHIRKHDVKDGVARMVSYFECPCPKHDTEKLRCTIHETRPHTCAEFPFAPEQVEDTPCSYWFENEMGLKRGGMGSPFPTGIL